VAAAMRAVSACEGRGGTQPARSCLASLGCGSRIQVQVDRSRSLGGLVSVHGGGGAMVEVWWGRQGTWRGHGSKGNQEAQAGHSYWEVREHGQLRGRPWGRGDPRGLGRRSLWAQRQDSPKLDVGFVSSDDSLQHMIHGMFAIDSSSSEESIDLEYIGSLRRHRFRRCTDTYHYPGNVKMCITR
jgi:hypothetical protein